MQLAPTPRSALLQDGAARLLRFHAKQDAAATRRETLPIVLVPSLINRWYVLDLRAGSSVVEALTEAGHDVYAIDWGEPGDEDRHLEWDEVVERLARMVRRVRRRTGAPRVGLLGYCIGGTLASIYTALEPDTVAALVNLAGPIDFSESGMLGTMTDPRWFDAEAIAGAGNIGAMQMQSGFTALRPTAQLSKWVSFFDKLDQPEKIEAFRALEAWASDNIAFPAAAYVRYIRELYQENRLVAGRHAIRGRPVDLSAIRCPLLTVVTSKDVICPPASARALAKASGATDQTEIVIPGGHVGAVVGAKARSSLYPQLSQWFADKLAVSETSALES